MESICCYRCIKSSKAINLWISNETQANVTYGQISKVFDSIKVTSKADGVTEGLTQGLRRSQVIQVHYNLMTVTDHEQALLDANQTAKLAIENAKADGVARRTYARSYAGHK